jgi:hypothetical protein
VSPAFWLPWLLAGGIVLSVVATFVRWLFSRTGKGSIGGIWDGLEILLDLLTGWPF